MLRAIFFEMNVLFERVLWVPIEQDSTAGKRVRGRNRRRFLPRSGADDGARTRDLRHGKATLYQLSYIRKEPHATEKAR